MVTLSEALKMNRRELLAVALTSTAVTVTHAQTPSPADFRQLLAGRDETIIEPEIPIIDAHHHLFVRPGLRYMIDDYLADARAGHRIVASVYVETLAFARPDGPECFDRSVRSSSRTAWARCARAVSWATAVPVRRSSDMPI